MGIGDSAQCASTAIMINDHSIVHAGRKWSIIYQLTNLVRLFIGGVLLSPQLIEAALRPYCVNLLILNTKALHLPLWPRLSANTVYYRMKVKKF